MMRTGLFVAIAILCASCRTDTQLDPIRTTATPIIDAAEISAREDCLYREVGRLLEPKGSPPTSLHNAAVAATRFCSEAVRSRFQRASVSALDAQNLARDDQAKTEQRAFAIGLELREKRTNIGTVAN
jgi:hypothetical protein